MARATTNGLQATGKTTANILATHSRHTGDTLKNYAEKTPKGIFGLIADLHREEYET